MRIRSLLYAALGGAFILAAGAPAYAQHDDHHGHFDRRDYHHPDWHRGYAPPPVVVSPPAYGYYAPPPVAYGPAPGITLGINIP